MFKMACGACGDIPSVLWSQSAIAIFTSFSEIFLFFFIQMIEISFKHHIYMYNIYYFSGIYQEMEKLSFQTHSQFCLHFCCGVHLQGSCAVEFICYFSFLYTYNLFILLFFHLTNRFKFPTVN